MSKHLAADRLSLRLLDRLGKSGNDFEEVAHGSNIGDLEDRRIGIFVDRDDEVRTLHAHEVLDRSRDSRGDVELRGHDLTRGAHLIFVGKPTRIDDGARSAQGAAQCIREGLEYFTELLLGTHAPAARNDDVGLAQIDARALGDLGLDELRLVGSERDLELDDASVGAAVEGLRGSGLHGRDDNIRFDADLCVQSAVEDAPLEDERAPFVGDIGAIAREAGVEPSGDARGDVPAARRIGEQDHVGARGLDGRSDRRIRALHAVVGQEFVVGDEDLAAALLRETIRKASNVLAEHEARDLAPGRGCDLLRVSGQLEAGLANLTTLNFCDDENAAHRVTPLRLCAGRMGPVRGKSPPRGRSEAREAPIP